MKTQSGSDAHNFATVGTYHLYVKYGAKHLRMPALLAARGKELALAKHTLSLRIEIPISTRELLFAVSLF
jgi:hypothetical protein